MEAGTRGKPFGALGSQPSNETRRDGVGGMVVATSSAPAGSGHVVTYADGKSLKVSVILQLLTGI